MAQPSYASDAEEWNGTNNVHLIVDQRHSIGITLQSKGQEVVKAVGLDGAAIITQLRLGGTGMLLTRIEAH